MESGNLSTLTVYHLGIRQLRNREKFEEILSYFYYEYRKKTSCSGQNREKSQEFGRHIMIPANINNYHYILCNIKLIDLISTT